MLEEQLADVSKQLHKNYNSFKLNNKFLLQNNKTPCLTKSTKTDCQEQNRIQLKLGFFEEPSAFHEIRIKNANRLIIGHLNINSLRNKFEIIEEIIKCKIEIFLISETKLDIYLLFLRHIFRRQNRALSNTEVINTLITVIRGLSSNNIHSDSLAQFTNIAKMILEKKTSLKKWYARYNPAIINFMNKNLQKAIMTRSRLLNRYKKEKESRSSQICI